MEIGALVLDTSCISGQQEPLTYRKYANPSILLFLVGNEWWGVSRCHRAWKTDEQLQTCHK